MHKIAFSLGSWSIYWYGVLVALGFMAGLWTASRRGHRYGLPAEQIMDVGPWLIFGAIAGSRLFYVINYWDQDFAGGPILEIFNIRRGGLVFYGGLIGAALATILCLRRKKLPLWKLADVFAPSIALGAFFGRVGCLMQGCCYGRPTALPWAIHFPADHETRGAGVHPSQVYDSLLNLALYAGLAWLYRRKKFDGQVFASHLVGYALLRSFVELFRGDYPWTSRLYGGWLTPAQFTSVGILLTGCILYGVLRRYSSKAG